MRLTWNLLLIAVFISVCQPSWSAAADRSAAQNSWAETLKSGSDAVDAGEYWKAEPLLKQAVIKAASFGENDLRLAKSLGELGRLNRIRCRFPEAEAYLEQELDIKRATLSKEGAELIPSMGSLVRFYLLHGAATKADPLTEEILAFVEGKLKSEGLVSHKPKVQKGMPIELYVATAAPNMSDPVIAWAITCDDLGGLYREHGNFQLSERLFKAALDLKTTVLGKDHLSLANSYSSLGDLCLDRAEYGTAETYYKEALAITEAILPPENPQVYARLDRLAKCLIKGGKTAQAEQLYLRAQKLWAAEPCKNSDEARSLYSLGNLYLDEKRFADAAPVLEKALRHAERYHGPWSAGLVPYLQRYSYCLYYVGQKAESERLQARAGTISGATQQQPAAPEDGHLQSRL